MRSGKLKGSAAVDVVIGAAIIIFILLPVFSVAVEKYIVMLKVQVIKDAVDLTNIATYNAIDAGYLGRCAVVPDKKEVLSIYRSILSKNLNLDENLSGKEGSAAEGMVIIESLDIYTEELPLTCKNGTELKRPSVHSLVIVPVKPSLYRKAIMDRLQKESIFLKVHVDSDIPVNN